MGKASLKRTGLLAIGLAGALAITLTAVPAPRTHAAISVIDQAALVKLTEQINSLTRQLEEMKAMNDALQAQIDAIGEVGRITLPTLSVDRLKTQIRANAGCLIPDLSDLMPSVSFDTIDIGNICRQSTTYRDVLFVNPEDLERRAGLITDGERTNDLLKAARDRREALAIDTVTKALASGDQGFETADELNSIADDIQRSVETAETSNERLQTIGQAQVGLLRGQAQNTRLMAMLVKLQAAFFLELGLDVRSTLSQPLDEIIAE